MKQFAIYVVRHGECKGNVSKSVLDPFTDSLTEVGKAQAELLGAHLKRIPFLTAYSSDYLRAEQTASIILDELAVSAHLRVNLNLIADKRLRERNSTGVISEPHGLMKTTSMESETSCPDTKIGNSETVQQFEDRIISFFSGLIQNLLKKDDNNSIDDDPQNILIVSHGFTIQKLMCMLNSRPSEFGIQQWTNNHFSERPIKNASYHKLVLKISDKVSVIGSVDCAHYRAHLDGNSNSPSNGDTTSSENETT